MTGLDRLLWGSFSCILFWWRWSFDWRWRSMRRWWWRWWFDEVTGISDGGCNEAERSADGEGSYYLFLQSFPLSLKLLHSSCKNIFECHRHQNSCICYLWTHSMVHFIWQTLVERSGHLPSIQWLVSYNYQNMPPDHQHGSRHLALQTCNAAFPLDFYHYTGESLWVSGCLINMKYTVLSASSC